MVTKKHLEMDLGDLISIMEGFAENLSKMTQAQKIDLAARLKPIGKACKTIDEAVKDMVKTKLKHKDGELKGELFKAELKLVPTTRLDQKALKENEPEIFEEYNKEAEDERVTFSLR